jgi:molybdopterin-containing oxidoreductase family membrane subunit
MFSFFISIVVNIGMWFERFVIIVTSLHRDFLPSSWTMFSPTFVDIGIFIGTIGFFFVLFLLYARTFPVIAQAEVKSILKSSGSKYKKLREVHGDNVKHYEDPTFDPGIISISADPKEYREGTPDTVNAETIATNKPEQEKIIELLSVIGTFDPDTQQQDDLQKISGVGPIMEQKLHQLGIYTFEQVSRMTESEYDLLDTLIDEFPGRAKRDDWAGQAQQLKNK